MYDNMIAPFLFKSSPSSIAQMLTAPQPFILDEINFIQSFSLFFREQDYDGFNILTFHNATNTRNYLSIRFQGEMIGIFDEDTNTFDRFILSDVYMISVTLSNNHMQFFHADQYKTDNVHMLLIQIDCIDKKGKTVSSSTHNIDIYEPGDYRQVTSTITGLPIREPLVVARLQDYIETTYPLIYDIPSNGNQDPLINASNGSQILSGPEALPEEQDILGLSCILDGKIATAWNSFKDSYLAGNPSETLDLSLDTHLLDAIQFVEQPNLAVNLVTIHPNSENADKANRIETFLLTTSNGQTPPSFCRSFPLRPSSSALNHYFVQHLDPQITQLDAFYIYATNDGDHTSFSQSL
jgi:hypothetical protein